VFSFANFKTALAYILSSDMWNKKILRYSSYGVDNGGEFSYYTPDQASDDLINDD
jgi:hypothetical protein